MINKDKIEIATNFKNFFRSLGGGGRSDVWGGGGGGIFQGSPSSV